MNEWGIPTLREDKLSTVVPTQTFAGGTVTDPARTLFLWRSCATEKARGGTLAFFLDDERLDPLWTRPARYLEQFVRCGIGSLVEVDFSMWTDMSHEAQRFNVYRQRLLARQWQENGVLVAPCLNWSDEHSFKFCFAGVPIGCPVTFTECRTPASSEADRQAFLRGLHEAVRQVRPRTLVIYGGLLHEWWIRRDLPTSDTDFIFLEAWTDARRQVRAAQARQRRERTQLTLFSVGGHSWAVEAPLAAQLRDEAAKIKVRHEVRRARQEAMNSRHFRGQSNRISNNQ